MTFELQVNGVRAIVLDGELRGPDHKLGPGGVFTVVTVAGWVFPKFAGGDTVRLIHYPDAPRTTTPNPAAREPKEKP